MCWLKWRENNRIINSSCLLTAVEEHVSDNGMFLVNLERMSAKYNTFGDDAIRIHRQQPTHSNQLIGFCQLNQIYSY